MCSHSRFGLAAEFAQAVFGVEGIHGGVAARPFDDAADDGIHFVAVLVEERADGGESLGDPRSGIEQVGRGAEDGEIDFDLLAADALRAPRPLRA